MRLRQGFCNLRAARPAPRPFVPPRSPPQDSGSAPLLLHTPRTQSAIESGTTRRPRRASRGAAEAQDVANGSMGDHDAPPADGVRSGATVVKHLPGCRRDRGCGCGGFVEVLHAAIGALGRGKCAGGRERQSRHDRLRRPCTRLPRTSGYTRGADVVERRGSGATRRGCEALSPLARVRRPGRPLSGSDHPRGSRAYLGSHRWAASGRAQRIPAPGVPSPAARAGPHASIHPTVFAIGPVRDHRPHGVVCVKPLVLDAAKYWR